MSSARASGVGRALALVAALVLPLLAGGCRKHPTATDWVLAWQDEFDGPAGQSPDASRWNFDQGTGWGNAQLEYDTSRPENVSLDGMGRLSIMARQESYNGCAYTSGRIQTRGHFAQATGRFEARMRMPTGRGLWPAFWLLGNDIDTAGWPACGEIDILEYRGQEPSIAQGSLHGPGYSGGNAVTHRYAFPGGGLDTDFHVYAIEWTTSSVTWSLDGVDYFTATPGNLPSGSSWVFNHPFFVVLDLAVGGTYVGSPDASTVFPQDLLIDYVRVYRKGD